MQRILITGAAGSMATMLRPRLRRPGRSLRLLDVRPVDDPADAEETVVGDVTDVELLAGACRDVDAVVHLAGEPTEAPWEAITGVNVDGARAVLEGCRRQAVRTVMLASSNHAVGLLPLADAPIPADAAPAPDSYYGWSKAAVELLGRLYHQRHDLDVVCLRIGRCIEAPADVRALSNWLSPDDLGRLVEAGLTVRPPAFRIVWGVSANTRSAFDQRAGLDIGYVATDDSESFADDVVRAVADAPGEQCGELVGGHFAARELGVRPDRRKPPQPSGSSR